MLRRHILQPMRQRQAHARRAHRRAHRQGRARRRGEGLLSVLRASHPGPSVHHGGNAKPRPGTHAHRRHVPHDVANDDDDDDDDDARVAANEPACDAPLVDAEHPDRFFEPGRSRGRDGCAPRRHAHDPGADANGGRGRVTRARHEVQPRAQGPAKAHRGGQGGGGGGRAGATNRRGRAGFGEGAGETHGRAVGGADERQARARTDANDERWSGRLAMRFARRRRVLRRRGRRVVYPTGLARHDE